MSENATAKPFYLRTSIVSVLALMGVVGALLGFHYLSDPSPSTGIQGTGFTTAPYEYAEEWEGVAPDAAVYFLAQDGTVHTTQTSRIGRYEILLPPGVYEVLGRETAESYRSRKRRNPSLRLTRVTVVNGEMITHNINMGFAWME